MVCQSLTISWMYSFSEHQHTKVSMSNSWLGRIPQDYPSSFQQHLWLPFLNSTYGDAYKIKNQCRTHDFQKHFLMLRIAETRNKLPTEIVSCQDMASSKNSWKLPTQLLMCRLWTLSFLWLFYSSFSCPLLCVLYLYF